MAYDVNRYHDAYPARIVNANRSPIMVYKGDSAASTRFNQEVHTLLRHLHYGAGARSSSFIVKELLNSGGLARQVIITWRRPETFRNAMTNNRRVGRGLDSPNSTDEDFLANPGAGDGSTIDINPWEWSQVGSGAPGSARDEILLHELVHAYMVQRGVSSVRNLNQAKYPAALRRFDIVDDFYAIMVTNVYASECGRPPRRDHRGTRALGRTSFEVRHDADFARFFRALDAHAPALVAELKTIKTDFNPWNITLRGI